MTTPSTLILAAFPPELAALNVWAEDRADVVLGICGIGMVQAAAETTRLLLLKKPQRVLFVGSVGGKAEKSSIFSLIAAEKAVLADYALATGRAYLPEIVPREYSADNSFLSKIASLPQEPQLTAVYSPAAISSDESLIETLTETCGSLFENLELFGVAVACSSANIPWATLSCVANNLGANAHLEWKKNHLQAASLTAEAVRLLF